MNQFSRNLVLWAVISLLMVVLFNLFSQPPGPQAQMSYTEFLNKVTQGEVVQVTIQGEKLKGQTAEGQSFQTIAPNDPDLVNRLLEKGVQVKAEPKEEAPWYMTLLVSWFPMLLLIGVWIFFMRQMQGGGGKAMSFGRSRARMISHESAKVTFDDVAGVDEAKEELTEVVDFLSNPKKFTRLGGRIPKGVLLVGPPGTGKTLLARAVAGEAGVPFFSISGSDFVEMFVGVGASRVRDLFVQGKKNAPCLIFIDEIDAVGRQRGAGLGGGHDEREQTLNQLLVEMDGFESNEGVILIAATNRPDVLDPALLRPGRFDRQVVVPTPDLRGRKRILEVHSKRTPLARDVDMEMLAKGTPGFSGADLENLVNEAALQAAKMNKDQVNMLDFETAKDKLLMGKERRSLVMSDKEKRVTAYHEGGHALTARLLPGTDPVHKVSIIPRGRALGVTMQLPDEDRHGYSRTYLLNNLVVLLGGRLAEEVVFGEITTGAGNDIERATKMARKMVCEWGMSDAIGPMNIGEQGEEVFIGREWAHSRNYSEETARMVDAEVKRIIDEAREKARTLLQENLDTLHRIAEALLERETINADDLERLIEGRPLLPVPEITATHPEGDAENAGPEDSVAAAPAEHAGDEFLLESDEAARPAAKDGEDAPDGQEEDTTDRREK
ncbi:ATP-dependent metalloprotease FtsH [Oleidesulfovibrio alaskensis G20]|uniref:ATP-dependent zinc metalloprotease FtsH n=1 Tax=Oleidesulfovibrio alaskensis (strain ATCC BAA-1058 / DSM 17464 / G20) TaxID=207559 RepID=Q311T4_OLEA2|nr:ATP-dependent zinc metalloprotease FtsH [Oleidesulfovibrio alaskensis]ABB38312.1 ATP-dependent metalloprotease FtsH [Oleidesulfovibrio alaskensis G20]MBG0774211.1 ATP-dependent metallopeptidase FtsH/Yme1/Tma family protein [Oleidesulfovibrio alaskensis]